MKMVSITLSIPENIRELMLKFPEINWSGFVRRCIEEKALKLAWKEKMLKALESEKEFDDLALKIGDKIKQGVWEKHKQRGW